LRQEYALQREMAIYGRFMKTIISEIQSFISQILVVSVLTFGICLFAGEIKLAALKKASQGSSKQSSFTERMTKMKVDKIIKQ